MPDKVTNEEELLIDTLFIDSDTRRITLRNPKENITEAQIVALETLILNGGTSTLLIGDKYGAQFRRINTVTKRNTTTNELDLSV